MVECPECKGIGGWNRPMSYCWEEPQVYEWENCLTCKGKKCISRLRLNIYKAQEE